MNVAVHLLPAARQPVLGLGQSARGTKGQLSPVCSLAWWQILSGKCGTSVSAGMDRLPYSAEASWWPPCSPFLPQVLSSPGIVIYVLICLLTVGLRNGNCCPVSYSSGYCLHCGYSWRSAFDAILHCFESRLFLSHQVNPSPDLGQ